MCYIAFSASYRTQHFANQHTNLACRRQETLGHGDSVDGKIDFVIRILFHFLTLSGF